MRIHHIAISVTNLETSVSFYRDNFGFKEIKRFTKEGWDRDAVFLKLGDMNLEISHFKGFSKNEVDLSILKLIGISHFGIEVENLIETHKKLKSKGVEIGESKKGTTCKMYCFLKDPDGISVELYEP